MIPVILIVVLLGLTVAGWIEWRARRRPRVDWTRFERDFRRYADDHAPRPG